MDGVDKIVHDVDKWIPETPEEYVTRKAIHVGSQLLKLDEKPLQQIAKDKARPASFVVRQSRDGAVHVYGIARDKFDTYARMTKGLAKGDLEAFGNAFVQLAAEQLSGADLLKAGLFPVVEYLYDKCAALTPMWSTKNLVTPLALNRVYFPDDMTPRPITHADPSLVFFVNGIWTSEDEAKKHSQKPANHLNRPVALIYNRSTGLGKESVDDVVEAVADRMWPILTCGGRVGLIKQYNKTTRQLTWLLTETSGKLSIVTHSQGCLVMRNALNAAARMDGGKDIASRVMWVAAGLPLSNKEIQVKPPPTRFFPLVHKDDLVSSVFGLRVQGEDDAQRNAGPHDFKEYIPDIKPYMVWPAPTGTL